MKIHTVNIVKNDDIILHKVFTDTEEAFQYIVALMDDLDREYDHVNDDTWQDVQTGEEVNLFSFTDVIGEE